MLITPLLCCSAPEEKLGGKWGGGSRKLGCAEEGAQDISFELAKKSHKISLFNN